MIHDRKKGIALLLMSAFFFAFMNLFVRLAGDLPSIQKSFFRNLIAFLFATFILWRTRQPFRIQNKKNIPVLLARSVFGTLGILFNFYAVDHLVFSDASMLNKLSPFFVLVFSVFFLRENLTLKQALPVLIAFAGSLLIVKPSFSNTALSASIIGFLGGMSAGAAYTAVRYLGQRGEKGSFIVFFFSGFSCLVTLPYLLFSYHSMTFYQLLMLLGAGFSAAGGQFCITAAYKYAPAREISVYDYTQIVFAALLGWIAFRQLPDRWSVLGYVVIISMGILVFLHDRRAAEKK